MIKINFLHAGNFTMNLKKALLAVAVIQASSGAAYAEEGSDSRFALEEVVITARKVAEGLQDAPIAVSAFTNQELENRGAIDVTDVAAAAPNVHFQTGGATSGMSAAPTVYIRGLGQSDFNINNDPAVGMYIDGIYLGRMIGSLTDLVDLERAEVLRGPQGTLFGRNSIGGAINLITKKPDPDAPFEGDITATFGERDFKYLRGTANIPISESVAARLGGFYRERDGYVDAVQYNDLKLGGEDVWGIRGALRFNLSENLTFDIAADYSERRDPPAAVVPTQLGNVSLNPGSGNVSGDDRSSFASGFRFNTGLRHFGAGTPPPPNVAWISSDTATCSDQTLVNTSLACYGNAHILGDDKVNSVWTNKAGEKITPEQALDAGGISAVLTWELEFGTLTSTSAYREMDAAFNNDGDFTPFTIFHNINDEFTQDQFSQELQLTGSVTDDLDYIVGLYYFEEDGEQLISLVAPLLPPAGAPPAAATLPFFQSIARGIENTSQASYGQLIYSISDSLRLTAGVRYTENEKGIDLSLLRGDEAAPWYTKSKTDDVTLDETNVLFNLAWNLDDETMIYGQFSNGFRDGGWPVRFPGLPVGLPPLDTVRFGPETVDSFELGVKSVSFDGSLRVNAAIFTSKYKEMQIMFSDPLLNGAPNTSNLGEATISGVEAEVNYVATDNLRFDISVGFLDAQIDEIEGGSLNSGADNTKTTITKDNVMPYTPDWQIALGVNYSIDLNSGAYIRSRLDWIYSDEQFFSIENSPRNFEDSYAVVNANVSFITPSEEWEFTLGAKNLLDEQYATTSRTQADTASAYESLSRPREVYLQARYRFGGR